MALRTAAEFIESLRDSREVYFRGERVKDVTQHPMIRIGVETACIDYQMAEDPRYAEFAVARREDGEPINRFLLPPRSADDLLLRRRLIEEGSRLACGFPPFAKEGGSDALHAVTIVAARMDQALGTRYLQRVLEWRKYLQDGDLSVAVAMTDVKGNRVLRPGQQHDPDLYVRVVERQHNGIVVRGAKAHITSAPYTNEILVVPTRNMTEGDRDYAVCFAVAANQPGLKMIVRPAPGAQPDLREHPVSHRYGIVEALEPVA